MKKTEDIGGRQCVLIAGDEPKMTLVQILHTNEVDGFECEARMIENAACGVPFAMVGIVVTDWAMDLMPWYDSNVSRDERVGQGIEPTLRYIEGVLLPGLRERFGKSPVVLGGYSLGGLFSLWAASQTSSFDAIAAVSPSVWIKGWLDYAVANPVNAKAVYLSLGDCEEHTRNKTFALVGDNIRAEHELLKAQLGNENCVLEWNKGSHFMDSDKRTARGFAWCLKLLASSVD